MIRATCPACGSESELADVLGGLTALCKNCGHRIPVPAARPKAPPVGDAVRAASGVTPPPPTPARLPQVGLPLNAPSHPKLPPDGITAQAGALPPTGGGEPASVQRLIAQGLSPEAAAEVVEKILEERIRQQAQSLARDERRTRLHRLVSGLVAGAYVLLAYCFYGTLPACHTGIAVLLPVACIWFSEEMGRFASRYSLTGTLPGVLIRWCGWLLLAAIGITIL